ncbi:MAG: purine-nucleoside phosphorylase [Proteobacteria bacterium]|nr:purine-nucleoside phosphorylase [Pseudomonadota bacterium]
MTHSWQYKSKQAATFIQKKLFNGAFSPSVFLVLGSGFRDVVKDWDIYSEIDMREIPGFPSPSVSGHGSKLIAATVQISKKTFQILVATGRVHLYEGYSPFEIAIPIMVAHELGIKNVILTNAAGGLLPNLKSGEIVTISDHLNLTGCNVGTSTKETSFLKFIDMQNAYHSQWRSIVGDPLKLSSVVYAGVLGPTFETPAEAKMLRVLGADIVGMSTVQEAIMARSLGQNLFACSFITNISGGPDVDHQDVLKSVQKQMPKIKSVLESAILNAPKISV